MTNTSVTPAIPPKLNIQQTLFTCLHASAGAVARSSPGIVVAPSVAAHFGGGVYKATIEEAISYAEQLIAGRRVPGNGFSACQQNAPVYVMGVVAVVTPKAPVIPPVDVKRFDLPCQS